MLGAWGPADKDASSDEDSLTPCMPLSANKISTKYNILESLCSWLMLALFHSIRQWSAIGRMTCLLMNDHLLANPLTNKAISPMILKMRAKHAVNHTMKVTFKNLLIVRYFA